MTQTPRAIINGFISQSKICSSENNILLILLISLKMTPYLIMECNQLSIHIYNHKGTKITKNYHKNTKIPKFPYKIKLIIKKYGNVWVYKSPIKKVLFLVRTQNDTTINSPLN